nr:peptidase C50, separase [Tanacetum cinerariifolium]
HGRTSTGPALMKNDKRKTSPIASLTGCRMKDQVQDSSQIDIPSHLRVRQGIQANVRSSISQEVGLAAPPTRKNFDVTLRDAKLYTFHMNHIVASRAWSITYEEFIPSPNINFICYLDSIHQKATILELIGDGRMALAALEWRKSLSLKRGPSFYLGRSHVAISKQSFSRIN